MCLKEIRWRVDRNKTNNGDIHLHVRRREEHGVELVLFEPVSPSGTPPMRWANYRPPVLNAPYHTQYLMGLALPACRPLPPTKLAHPGLCQVTRLRLMKSTREPLDLTVIFIASSVMAGDL